MAKRKYFAIMCTAKDGKKFALRDIRFTVSEGFIEARAEISGNQSYGEPFLAELTNVTRNLFETIFAKYGFIELEEEYNEANPN